MSIMETLKAAEACFQEGLGYADEILTTGRTFAATLKSHRDDLSASSGALLKSVGGMASAIKGEVAAEQKAEGEAEKPEGAPAGAGSATPGWDALQGQIAKLGT